tara:strand:- start:1349 stop:2911 length:1563 start_codon:yes stop_codon:yes gene_type:complete
MKSYDVLVIGAGHNGMAASIKLANSGRKVLLLENSSQPGGMASSKDICDGFKSPTLAHLINHLSSRSINELNLTKFGLETNNFIIPSISINSSGEHISVFNNYKSNSENLSSKDKENLERLIKRLTFQSSLLKRFLFDAPVNNNNITFSKKLKFLKTGLDLRLRGKEEFQEFFRMILMCVADVLEEEIDNDLLKGLLAFDGTLGINLGPRSPTSLMGLLYKISGEFNGQRGIQVLPKGGIKNLVDAFYKSAISSGVETIFNQEVESLILEDNKVVGVKTKNGQEYKANIVLSSVSPIKTFLKFIGPKRLDTGVLRELNSLRYKGNVSKLNLALDKVPTSEFLKPELLKSRIVYAPSIDHIEENFNPSKYKELPKDPNLEVLFPSIIDETLSPKGSAIASIIVQNTPYDLKNGWEKSREQFCENILSKLELIFPNLKKSIISTQFLSPSDIEDQFNVPGGHWHHSELQIDRMYSLRPIFKFSNYNTPIENLYICGAGTHPGGGISGISGINSANQILLNHQ